MGNLKISSVQGKTEDQKKYRRDTRSLSEKFIDFLHARNNLVFVSGGITLISAGLFFVAPWSTFFLFPLVGSLYFHGVSFYRKRHLPIRLPTVANMTDYGDPAPGHFKYKKAQGIFFLGNSKLDEAEDGWGEGEEFWVADTDMRRHFLVFGSTGSGKTVTLVGMSFNALAMGSGLIYIDPKADAKLVTQIYKIARFLGREEDVRVLNFMTGNRDQAVGTRRSNTVNPFAFGDATSLSDILASMIPASEGDNAIFSQRAISLIKAIMPPLVEMRDRNERLLSVETIREFLVFDKFVELGKRANQGHFSDKVKSTMAAYLGSLGLRPDGEATSQKQGKPDNSKAVEQFQYATMYFTRAMDSLATDYGYIYNVIRGEVDYRDVFFNRRILVVLLPALEKNESEIALLGKLVLFAIKNALASGLGSRIEGSSDQTLGSRPSSSNRSMLLVLDEYAALQVKGFAEAATQGRSLGASCVFANQDLAGFMKASEAEADQILANTRCQIFMYQGDMSKTMDYIVKKAGRAAVMKTQGYSASPDSVTGTYADKQEATLEMTERAVATDFLRLTEGEFFLVFDDKFVVGQAFFDPIMDPKGDDVMRMNRLLMISPPDHSEIGLLATEGERLVNALTEIISGKIPRPVDSGHIRPMIENLAKSHQVLSGIDMLPEESAISLYRAALRENGIGESGKGTSSRGGASVGRSPEPSGAASEGVPWRDDTLPEEDGGSPHIVEANADIFDSLSVGGDSGSLSSDSPHPPTTARERLAYHGIGGAKSYDQALKIEKHLSGRDDVMAAEALDGYIDRVLSDTLKDGTGEGVTSIKKRIEMADVESFPQAPEEPFEAGVPREKIPVTATVAGARDGSPEGEKAEGAKDEDIFDLGA